MEDRINEYSCEWDPYIATNQGMSSIDFQFHLLSVLIGGYILFIYAPSHSFALKVDRDSRAQKQRGVAPLLPSKSRGKGGKVPLLFLSTDRFFHIIFFHLFFFQA